MESEIQPINLEEAADIIAGKTDRDYSKWHVTNLIESAYQISKGNTVYHEYEGEPKGIMSLGRIWEGVVDQYMVEYAASRNLEYIADVVTECSGIVASLDGMLLSDTEAIVVETKLRFTLNQEIPLRHLQQTRVYCAVLMAGKCTLSVGKVMYPILRLTSTPPTAVAEMVTIQHSLPSIRETWDMIINTKTYLESLGIKPGAENIKLKGAGQ